MAVVFSPDETPEIVTGAALGPPKMLLLLILCSLKVLTKPRSLSGWALNLRIHDLSSQRRFFRLYLLFQTGNEVEHALRRHLQNELPGIGLHKPYNHQPGAFILYFGLYAAVL